MNIPRTTDTIHYISLSISLALHLILLSLCYYLLPKYSQPILLPKIPSIHMTLLPQLSAEKTMNNNKMGPFSEQKTQKNLVTKSNSHIKNNRLHTNNPNIPIQKHQNKEKNTNHSSIQDKYLIDAETTQHNITEDAMEPITTPVDVQAAYARNPSPPYPTLARRMGTQGRLVLRVQVSEQGHVTQIQLKTSSHSELLDNAARQAVLHWQFNPAQKAGKAISTWVDVPITFQLNT